MNLHFVCYFNFDITNQEILKCILSIFKCNRNQVGELLEDGEYLIRYETLYLSDLKEGFYKELNIYVTPKIVEQSGVYNNLLLGLEITSLINKVVLINDESNDPYQWLLLDNEGKLYLVEENDDNLSNIVLKANRFRLSFSKSLKLLPNLTDVRTKNIPYYVDNSKFWLEAIVT